VKLDAKNIRWKLNWIEIEREDGNEKGTIFKYIQVFYSDDICMYRFPINRWLDSNQNPKLDILVNEGPVEFGNFRL
jgi:hypothetical protein